MAKNVILGALLVVVAAGILYFVSAERAIAPITPNNAQVPASEAEAEICIQVITPAVNPETGDITEFPTPCDVPDGWEVIENEIPTLDLEVQ